MSVSPEEWATAIEWYHNWKPEEDPHGLVRLAEQLGVSLSVVMRQFRAEGVIGTGDLGGEL
jgi:hypothetical protein